MKVTELIEKNVIVAPFNAYGIITYSDDKFTVERIPVAEQANGILPYKRYD